MKRQSTLHTDRLLLQPFKMSDARRLPRLAGDYDVARTTLNVPYPYSEEHARNWISTHRTCFNEDKAVVFAICLKLEGSLIGSMGLGITKRHNHAELGYWLGRWYWGQGYCTEAGHAVLAYAFEEVGLHRVHSGHFGSNPASGRVMQKLGMTWEGTRREHWKKWDRYEDAVLYGITAEEWRAARDAAEDA